MTCDDTVYQLGSGKSGTTHACFVFIIDNNRHDVLWRKCTTKPTSAVRNTTIDDHGTEMLDLRLEKEENSVYVYHYEQKAPNPGVTFPIPSL